MLFPSLRQWLCGQRHHYVMYALMSTLVEWKPLDVWAWRHWSHRGTNGIMVCFLLVCLIISYVSKRFFTRKMRPKSFWWCNSVKHLYLSECFKTEVIYTCTAGMNKRCTVILVSISFLAQCIACTFKPLLSKAYSKLLLVTGRKASYCLGVCGLQKRAVNPRKLISFDLFVKAIYGQFSLVFFLSFFFGGDGGAIGPGYIQPPNLFWLISRYCKMGSVVNQTFENDVSQIFHSRHFS